MRSRRSAAALIVCLAATLAARCASMPTLPTIRNGTPPVADNNSGSPPALTILTWNIWLMPPISGEDRQNGRRAKAIAAELERRDADHDFDVLCLEKAFDTGPRKTIGKALAAKYPYQYGPANSGGFGKFNSGVWVLSAFPFEEYHQIQFKACVSFECFSRKGAMLLTGSFRGHRFQLLVTHLQGEQGTKYESVRARQVREIRDDLLAVYADPTVPLILAGDFTTERRIRSGEPEETDEYKFLLRTLGVENGAEYRITLNDDPAFNDLCDDCNGRRAEMDYVFIRGNGTPLDVSRRVVQLQHPGWDLLHRHSDLSYHFGVAATVTFR